MIICELFTIKGGEGFGDYFVDSTVLKSDKSFRGRVIVLP